MTPKARIANIIALTNELTAIVNATGPNAPCTACADWGSSDRCTACEGTGVVAIIDDDRIAFEDAAYRANSAIRRAIRIGRRTARAKGN